MNKFDALAVAARGTLGAIPVVGTLAAEVIGAIIPNQRADRICRLLESLSRKVQELEQERLQSRFKDTGFVDVLEDSFHQTARAGSQDRIDYLASLLKNSLAEEDLQAARQKHILYLLGQINDVQVLILRFSVCNQTEKQAMLDTHRAVLIAPTPTNVFPPTVFDEKAIRDSYRNQLTRLGLMDESFRDGTGLGLLFLSYIDMLPPSRQEARRQHEEHFARIQKPKNPPQS